MKYRLIEAKTSEAIHDFYVYFSLTLAKFFPHYSKKTIDYFVNSAFNEKYFQDYSNKNDINIFLSLVDNKISGYLVAVSPYGGIGFCSWVAVDEKFRGMGIASALLDAWEKTSLKQGAHKLQLWTDVRNVEFYKKRGFELLGKVSDNYFGSDDYYFYKTLRKSSDKNIFKK